MPGRQHIRPLRPCNLQPLQGPVPDPQSRDPVPEPHLRPQGQQLPPQVHQGHMEHIRPHMGLGVIEDLLRRTAFYQFL